MPELIVLRAISGAGKSTWARKKQEEEGHVVVSRDDLRLALHGVHFGPEVDEEYITVVEHCIIREALRSGHSVISDNTNIIHRFAKKIATIGWEEGARVSVHEINIPLEEALKRNKDRYENGGRFVPPDVIKKQFEKFKPLVLEEPPEFKAYKASLHLPHAIIVDLDGTLSLMNRELRSPFEWDKVGLDKVREPLRELINSLARDVKIKVILLSGRDSAAREPTVNWLDVNKINYDHLYMRIAGDMRPDTVVKMELFDEYIRNNYHVIGVFDDRNSVVRTWLKYNIPVYHVNPFSRDF